MQHNLRHAYKRVLSTLQEGRTEMEKRKFQGGRQTWSDQYLKYQQKGLPTRYWAHTGRSVPEEAEADISQRPIAFVQILFILPPPIERGFPPHASYSYRCRILVQDGDGEITSSSLQPISQQQLCTLYGRTLPLIEQTARTALIIKKFSLPWEGKFMFYNSYHLVLVPPAGVSSFLHSTCRVL